MLDHARQNNGKKAVILSASNNAVIHTSLDVLTNVGNDINLT